MSYLTYPRAVLSVLSDTAAFPSCYSPALPRKSAYPAPPPSSRSLPPPESPPSTYPAPAPSGNRHTIVSLHGNTVNMEGPGTVTSRAQNPGHFQAIVRSAGPSGTHGDVRIRYLALWTDSSA